jgi:phage gpG-like protein
LVIELEGQREFDRTFTRFTENLRDFRQLWPSVISVLRKISEEQFAFEGRGKSGAWQPLSPKYAAWKEKNYPGSPILQRTGALQLSLTSNTAHSIVRAGKEELEFGTTLRYGIYHQSRKPRKRLPRRPIFDFNEQDKNRVTKAIQARLIKAGRDNGVTVK